MNSSPNSTKSYRGRGKAVFKKFSKSSRQVFKLVFGGLYKVPIQTFLPPILRDIHKHSRVELTAICVSNNLI